MKISGFMHVAQMGGWRAVLDEQMGAVRSSGLALRCAQVFLGVLGAEPVHVEPPFSVLYQSPNLTFFEYETLSRVRDYSERSDGLVWYIHTKGVSKTQADWDEGRDFYRNTLGVGSLSLLQKHEREWRHYMQHFVIRQHQRCSEALQACDLAGVSWREKACPHFSGNFWWARTSYLRGLGDPYDFSNMIDVLGNHRGGAECWVGSGSPSVMSFSNLRHNFYRWGVPPKDYLPLHL